MADDTLTRFNGSLKAWLGLKPGDLVTLETEEVGTPMKSTFVGRQGRDCVVVHLPQEEGIGFRFPEGSAATLRFLHKGTAYGFRTGIMGKYVKGPMRFMFLNYPQIIETRSLRKHHRIRCFLLAHLVASDLTLQGVVVDMGPGGVSFHHRPDRPMIAYRKLFLEKNVDLFCSLLGGDAAREIHCLVRNINIEEDHLAIGMQFAEGNEELSGKIKIYIDRIVELLGDEVLQ